MSQKSRGIVGAANRCALWPGCTKGRSRPKIKVAVGTGVDDERMVQACIGWAHHAPLWCSHACSQYADVCGRRQGPQARIHGHRQFTHRKTSAGNWLAKVTRQEN